jgi:hypothetical protein
MAFLLASALIASPGAAKKPPAAEARVLGAVGEEAARAGKKPTLARRPGALGTTVVTAAIPDAYPGTGVACVVLDGSLSYGRHGERDLADLARKKGWLKKAPPTDELVRLVNDAEFEGLLQIDDTTPPVATLSAAGLELRLQRRTFPSGAFESVRILLPPKSKALVEVGQLAPAAGGTPAAPPQDPLAEAERALEHGSPAEQSAAITALSARRDARALALLAHATTLGNEQLTADAIVAIGASPEAAAALKKAWAPLDAARRQQLLQLAAEAHGAAFADRLR